MHHPLDISVRMRETVQSLNKSYDMKSGSNVYQNSPLWFRRLSRKNILLIHMPVLWNRDCRLIYILTSSSEVVSFLQRFLISSDGCSEFRRCLHIRVISVLWNLWKHLHTLFWKQLFYLSGQKLSNICHLSLQCSLLQVMRIRRKERFA